MAITVEKPRLPKVTATVKKRWKTAVIIPVDRKLKAIKTTVAESILAPAVPVQQIHDVHHRRTATSVAARQEAVLAVAQAQWVAVRVAVVLRVAALAEVEAAADKLLLGGSVYL